MNITALARRLRPAFVLTAALTALALGCAHIPATSARAAATGTRPQPWQQVADVTESGFSAPGLDAAFALADQAGSAAVMVVSRGEVIAAWGDVARRLELHSVRKSVYSALYGIAVARGLVRLDATLAELGVDDLQPLTKSERSARLEDLLAARSGVYHPAAYSPSDMRAELPGRGSHPPGTFFFYNNWDFNVVASVLERATGGDLYATFDRWLARPLGMEDWRPVDGYRAWEPRISRWPAHTFRLSARDLARIGVLYAEGGRWHGAQVIPASWVELSTTLRSPIPGGGGYGLMWWVYPAGSAGADKYPHLDRQRIWLARGTGGQAMFVLPDLQLVVVHRADTDQARLVPGRAIWAMLEAIVAAREGDGTPRPRLDALHPRPLPGAPPPAPPIATSPAPITEAQALVGRYALASDTVAEIFLHDGRP